jgi:hypothetical protein
MLRNRRALLVEEHLDHGLCHGVRTPPDAIDFVVAQSAIASSPSGATPPNQDLVVGFAGWKVVHRNAPQGVVVVGVALRTSRVCRDVPVKCADEGFCRHHAARRPRDGVTATMTTEFAGDQGGASGSWPGDDRRSPKAEVREADGSRQAARAGRRITPPRGLIKNHREVSVAGSPNREISWRLAA